MQLKARIGKWQTRTPASQFQQYGPLNKYFNLKFNRDTHMVKPQALFRQPLDDEDSQLLLEWGEEEDDPLPDDDDLRQRVRDLREERMDGNISVDSTHHGYARRSNVAGEKNYPDFVICAYNDSENDPLPTPQTEAQNDSKDRVRLLVEIATLPRNLTEDGLRRLQRKTKKQLVAYLNDLMDGERWDRGKIMGMALVGTQVLFVLPRYAAEGSNEVAQWLPRGGESEYGTWYSLFGKVFQSMMSKAVSYGA
ncbi:hypothetical protein C8Q76DRAFT_739357 [Earliella scabrosa]|nr:hypothetical protein C8Q76DRAFT_739357 [Earliella scabrosa]